MEDDNLDNGGEDTAEKIRAGLSGGDNTDDVDTGAGDGEDDNSETEKTEAKKPSDAEAKLLKEVMKHKAAAKKAADDLKALKSQVDGLDLDAVKALLAKREEEENTILEKKGEYDRLLVKQTEAANAKIKEAADKAEAAAAENAKLMKSIEDLTTGQAFSNSKFVAEKLTLTPNKAKALYKSHFEFVDGKMVAYDAPAGEADRTPIVDENGAHVDFETAIAAIIAADPDKDFLLKSDTKPGAGSKPSAPQKQKEPDYIDTTDKISAGLEAYFKNSGKK